MPIFPQPDTSTPTPRDAAPSGQAPARYALHPNAAWRDVGGEVFVITDDRAFHRLRTATAADLLRALAAGTGEPEALVSTLTAKYQVDVVAARADVDRFLATLVAKRIAVATTEVGPR